MREAMKQGGINNDFTNVKLINKLQEIDDVKKMMNTRQAVKSVEG